MVPTGESGVREAEADGSQHGGALGPGPRPQPAVNKGAHTGEQSAQGRDTITQPE